MKVVVNTGPLLFLSKIDRLDILHGFFRLASNRYGFQPVRAGLAYDQTPSPGSTLSPTLPDSSRILVAAGAGFNLPRGFVIDVAYMYVHMLERSASGENFPGTYNASAHLIGLSFGYRWVKKKK